jgi:hypothetical protein
VVSLVCFVELTISHLRLFRHVVVCVLLFDTFYRPVYFILGKLNMIFVYECYVSPMFQKEFGQEVLIGEYSICIPEHDLYRSVDCSMTGVSEF